MSTEKLEEARKLLDSIHHGSAWSVRDDPRAVHGEKR